MPTGCRAEQLEFEGVGGRRVIADFEGGAMTSDAGALLLRHADRTIKLIDRVAGCFVDHRSADFVVHGLPALVGQRIVGIALGYEDVSLLHEYEAKIAALERKVGQLTMEVDFLKGAQRQTRSPNAVTTSIVASPVVSASDGRASS